MTSRKCGSTWCLTILTCTLVVMFSMMPTPVRAGDKAKSTKGTPTDHGGEGIMSGQNCFKTTSQIIPEVCADYNISWKLWILMGEPVGDYRLKWKLKSFKIAFGEGPGANSFMSSEDNWGNAMGVDVTPPELQKAVKSIELYLDGDARVGQEYIGPRARHSFNTGTATKAGMLSFNTPGSPNWSETFFNGTTYDGNRSYLSAEEAKAIFTASHQPDLPLQLSDFRIGPNSSVTGLGALENRISTLCSDPKTAPRYSYCPKIKKETKKSKEKDSIDDAFSKLDKAKGKTGTKSGSSIDDAFSSLNKGKATKAGQGVDAGFDDLATHRAEVEQQRKIALAEAERQRIAEESLAAQREEDRRFCDAAAREKEECLIDACGEKPNEYIRSHLDVPPSQKVFLAHVSSIETRSDAASSDIPGVALWSAQQNAEQRTLVKIAGRGPDIPLRLIMPKENPLYKEWKTCRNNNVVQCGIRSKAYGNLDECLKQREKDHVK